MFFWSVSLAIATTACNPGITVTDIRTRELPADESPVEASEKTTGKLAAADCTDPRARDLRSGTTMMACDGSELTGTLELSLLQPENIRSGIEIDGVTGTLESSTPITYTPRSGDPDVASAVNLSAADPLLSMTNDQAECHRRFSDGQSVRNRGETVLYADGKFEMFIICHYGKWNMARAQWTPGTAAVWIDHNPATAAIDPLWDYNSTNSEGRAHFEHAVHLALQVNSDNTVEGIYFQSASPWWESGLFRVAASSVTALNSASIIDQGNYNDDPAYVPPAGETTVKNWLIDNQTDDAATYPSWSSFDFTIHGGQKYISYQYGSGYSSGMAIKQYTDLRTLTLTSPDKLFPALYHGYILSHSDKIYMMAYDPADGAWKMAMADTVANLGWSQAVDLKLRNLFGPGSGWSEVATGLRNRINSMPDIFGFDVHDNQFYFFYRSGDYHAYEAPAISTDPDTGEVTEYAKRGVGVVRMSKLP